LDPYAIAPTAEYKHTFASCAASITPDLPDEHYAKLASRPWGAESLRRSLARLDLTFIAKLGALVYRDGGFAREGRTRRRSRLLSRHRYPTAFFNAPE
jgi:hypothetical protein